MVRDSSQLSIEKLLEGTSVNWNLDDSELARRCLEDDECRQAINGAVVAYSGKYTGRTPKDKFIVDNDSAKDVWWGGNSKISETTFGHIRSRVLTYLEDRPLYVVDTLAGADPAYRIKVRFIVERPYHALFTSQLFIEPSESELENFEPDWLVIDAGKFQLDPKLDGSRTEAAIILNFAQREVVIAGTEYGGEMKKSIFTVMNFLLPQQGVMSMHCSANIGERGDTTLFFGLSGTGKTSLSADPDRGLIGDDEHGWSNQGVFNIEGGCYAKCINLSREHEPEIWDAIGAGAVLENVVLNQNGVPDYSDQSITENTRAAYPLSHVPNALNPSVGGHPNNIFFLTCDALGLLPPISRLTPSQILVYFLNGYTAKVAGTELGVKEPTLTFSTCFGQPFLPLDPHVYASLIKEKIERHGSKVWLLNTGWTGGGYGVGHRISIEHTRAMLDAAINGFLDDTPYDIHEIFELQYPISCPNVPSELLDVGGTWASRSDYDEKAKTLQNLFRENASKFGLVL